MTKAAHTKLRTNLHSLIRRISRRNTGFSWGEYHQRAKGRPWYGPAERAAVRHDWREVVFRWLRRYYPEVEAYAGGHHVRLVGLGLCVEERDSRHLGTGNLKVDGKPCVLVLVSAAVAPGRFEPEDAATAFPELPALLAGQRLRGGY